MKTYQNPSDIFYDPTAPLFPLQLAVFPLPKKTSSQNITLSSPSWQPPFFSLQTPLFLLFLPSSVRVFLRKPTILCYTSHLPPPKQPTRKPSEKKQKNNPNPQKPSSSGGGGGGSTETYEDLLSIFGPSWAQNTILPTSFFFIFLRLPPTPCNGLHEKNTEHHHGPLLAVG